MYTPFSAPRFQEGAALTATARSIGLPQIGDLISRSLDNDRAVSTIAMYKEEAAKFQAWKITPAMASIPVIKARNLYLAKCASEGRQKALNLIVAALNYFCGPLTGVDKDIQASILEAKKRITPPTQHRTKIDSEAMRKLILQGTSSADPKVIQAAALALIQFKAFLRISEARSLRLQDLERVGDRVWRVDILRFKTNQYNAGASACFELDNVEQGLLDKYLNTIQGHQFLFQSSTTNSPLTCATLRDRLKSLLRVSNLDHLNITSHSFRGVRPHSLLA